jgi:phosphatidylserine/phosphatidylglycerophosphate/cardiolipin synthase-like enzyme
MKRWHVLIIACSFFLAGFLLSDYLKDFRMPICSFSSGNIVPIVNDNYFNITYSEIQNAQKSVDIILYEFKWYDSNNSVVQMRNLLISEAQKNITVRMIIDQTKYMGMITELSKENKKTGDYLKANGILVKYDSFTQTTHDKLVIIDNEEVIVGSHNWGFSAFEKNNEASVLIKDKGTAEYYEDYFENLWKSY